MTAVSHPPDCLLVLAPSGPDPQKMSRVAQRSVHLLPSLTQKVFVDI